MRLGEDDELLVKSPCLFSGYLHDPGTTREVLRNGWLHTGDNPASGLTAFAAVKQDAGEMRRQMIE